MDINKLIEKMSSGRQFRNMEMRAIADEEGKEKQYRVSGYATTFNQPYVLWRTKWDGTEYEFREQVDSHAFDDCDMSDVIFQLNHEGRVYARNKNGTLSLSIDNHGLAVDAYLGGTEEGRKIHEEIEKRYLDKMSFCFVVAEDKREEVEEDGKITITRTVKRISKIYDTSVVSIPANDQTSISARSYCDGVIEELKAERLKAAEEEKRKKDLEIQMEARERELSLLELSM